MSAQREDIDWSVRLLKQSGRWQARYKDPDGRRCSAGTFGSHREASEAAMARAAEVRKGSWKDPSHGEELFANFAVRALTSREPDLAVKTLEGYWSLLKNHLLPAFGAQQLKSIKRVDVDLWYAEASKRLGPVALRNSYFLMRGLMRRAVDWELISTNPCRRENAGKDVSKPRPALSFAQAVTLIKANPPALQPLLWLALHTHLRLGEACALLRSDLDLDLGTLRIERQVQDVKGGSRILEPKYGSIRTVPLSALVTELMRGHLAANPQLPMAPLFTSPRTAGAVRRQYVQTCWARARATVGLFEFHFHDLRHLGLTTAAQAGATQRELMELGGHSTAAAALRYQHAAADRQTELANRTGALMPIPGISAVS